VEECVGRVSVLARDQHGCRFLQRKFDEEGRAAVNLCFDEIIAEVVELMMDPFGNYLVQKLLECCDDEQRVRVLRAVAVARSSGSGREEERGEEEEGAGTKTKVPAETDEAVESRDVNDSNDEGGAGDDSNDDSDAPNADVRADADANSPGGNAAASSPSGEGAASSPSSGSPTTSGSSSRSSATTPLGGSEDRSDRSAPPPPAPKRPAAARGGDGGGVPELVYVALNTHGTRAVQKLIETLATPEQVRLAAAALEPGTVTLIKDLNGNHVIQRCLQRLQPPDNQFIYDAAKAHSVEIATHRHGCCVLQRCVDHAGEEQRRELVREIASRALTLSQDPFGNYVVQYILDLGLPWCNAEVMMRLAGNYAELSTQKFSSNVVEKCLKLADQSLEERRDAVVREIMNSPLLDRLLMDPYGNYVVQSTLSVTRGSLHAELVERIRPHLPLIKNSPFGKRILRLLLENKK
jgi:pumilio RNA-binding family